MRILGHLRAARFSQTRACHTTWKTTQSALGPLTIYLRRGDFGVCNSARIHVSPILVVEG